MKRKDHIFSPNYLFFIFASVNGMEFHLIALFHWPKLSCAKQLMLQDKTDE